MDEDELKQYIKLKLAVNVNPNSDDLITASPKLVYRLVRDFLKELKEPFMSKKTTDLMVKFCNKNWAPFALPI